MSKADPALIYYHDNNNLIDMIAMHVSDFLWSGTNDFETNFISKLQNTLMIGKENQSIFSILRHKFDGKWFKNYYWSNQLYRKPQTN